MKRLFCSCKKPCASGCKYCFARFLSEPDAFGQLATAEQIDEAIVYPCCDGELEEQGDWLNMAKSFLERVSKVYLSFSTKRIISDSMLKQIIALHKELQEKGRGFVKVGISVSNKSLLEEIEPNTASYVERLDLARHLFELGLPVGLTLKPILPFISNEEYFSIIDDFGKYTNKILVGGLYYCRETEFYKDYQLERYESNKRTVRWLSKPIEWDYIGSDVKITAIRDYSRLKNLDVFDSDEKLIESIVTGV